MAKHSQEELSQRVKRQIDARRARQAKNYRLARGLGFSSEEAAVLQNWTEKTIRELAGQRRAGQEAN